MPTLTKILTTTLLSLGLFLSLGVLVASASPADTLQPATAITYNEELVVNNTIRVDSAYIGKQGTGGVTFFNGTIVNSTTDADTGAEMPVTFGDDVRIDGEIYRTEVGGDNPIKLADSIRPQTDNTYDLGTSTYGFQDGYFAGTVNIGALGGTGVVSSANITDGTIVAADLASNSVTSAKIADGTIAAGDLASNSVTGAKIVAGTVVGSDISSTTDITAASFTGALGSGGQSISNLEFGSCTVTQANIGTVSANSYKVVTCGGITTQADDKVFALSNSNLHSAIVVQEAFKDAGVLKFYLRNVHDTVDATQAAGDVTFSYLLIR